MKTLEGKWIYLSVAAIFGIIASGHWVLFGILFILLFLLTLGTRQSKQLFLLLSIGFCIFYLITSIEATQNHALPSQPSNFFGRIISLPKFDGDRLTFVAKLDNREKVLVVKTLATENEKLSLQQDLSVGSLCQIKGSAAPPNLPSNFHQFNYKSYLQNERIYNEITTTRLTCQDKTITLLDRIRQLRQSGISYIEDTFPESLKGIVIALVFGDRNDLSPDVINAYQSLGLIHLLAVSGLHVGIVTGFLYYLMIRLGLSREKSAIAICLFLPIYMIITGGAAAIMRAGLMMLSLLMSQVLKKQVSTIDVISWVFLILLAVNPRQCYALGFQLSFTVAYSLLFSYPIISKYYKRRWQQIFATSVIAQVCALPILLYNFFGFSPIGILLNIVFIPLISLIILPCSFLSFLLVLIFPTFSHSFLLQGLGLFVSLMHRILTLISSWSFSQLILGRPPKFILILLVVAIIFSLLVWEKDNGRRKGQILGLSMITFVLFIQWLLPYLNNEGKVTFLDVGQGDAILIELPHRKGVYLIDTGGQLPFNQAAWKVRKSPYKIGIAVDLNELKGKGIRHIDRVILTHRDFDHMGALYDLGGKIPINHLIISDVYQPRPSDVTLFNTLIQEGTQVQKVMAGAHWQVGSNNFYVLGPMANEIQSNNRSVVIYAEMGGVHWLFTGDAEIPEEQKIIKAFPNLSIDILKVGHHGSRTATSDGLLQAIQAKIAVISVGKNNRYGHPTQEVLDRLTKYHMTIFRTDQLGAIQMTFSNNKTPTISIKTMKTNK